MLSVAGTCNILMLLLELSTAGSKMCIPGAVSEFICVLRVRCTVSINKLFQELRCVEYKSYSSFDYKSRLQVLFQK